MDISPLEDIGLTASEIRVYLKLLELGTATAGQILDGVSIQNSVMHRALHSLINKGLINFILEGRRKVYQAAQPEHLLDIMDDKRRHLQELLPDLKRKQRTAQCREKAAVFKGIRGIKEVYTILVNSKAKVYLTFGGGHPCEALMGTAWWRSLHTKRIGNKLFARQVFDSTVKKFGEELNKRPLSKVRFLSREFAQFQETVIAGNLVAIAVFTENPYAFLIEDKVVADGYRKHFELLWKTAR